MCYAKRIVLLARIFLLFTTTATKNYRNTVSSPINNSKVKISAVFMNCKANEALDGSDPQSRLFQRNEMFKYDVLRGCNKKIAVTLKLSANSEDSGVDYIPIEHVIDGPTRKRVRLLDPLVLRLRRVAPLQAYKLHHAYNVRAILTGIRENEEVTSITQDILKRFHRDLDSPGHTEDSDIGFAPSTLGHIPDYSGFSINLSSIVEEPKESNPTTLDDVISLRPELCDKANSPPATRNKRQEYNVVVENSTPDLNTVLDIDVTQSIDNRINNSMYTEFDVNNNVMTQSYPFEHENLPPDLNNAFNYGHYFGETVEDDRSKEESTVEVTTSTKFTISSQTDDGQAHYKPASSVYITNENDALYSLLELREPELWHALNLRLLQKTTDQEGKAAWFDVTAGANINVGTHYSDWMNDNVAIKYRSADWLNRSQFVLPVHHLSVLKKLDGGSGNNQTKGFHKTNYIIVPKDDILHLERRDKKSFEGIGAGPSFHRRPIRVVVNMKRAFNKAMKNNLNVVPKGQDLFLTVPHHKQIEAVIDIEARADNNDLIRMGSSARISTVVADSTRLGYSVINLQVTNTGLAAHHFSAKIRDCGIELCKLLGGRTDLLTTASVLIPPRHTKRLVLELPMELPTETVHCSVELVNNDDETVAVRDVTLQKMDRCFCVWHCNCVCLGLDPKLMCNAMSPTKLLAAGISDNQKPRVEREIYYDDCVTLNLVTIIFGVLSCLLMLGFTKACVGIVIQRIGIMGLDKIVKIPRHIEHYHEPWLKNRRVICDSTGWPLHPDTKRRTVRVMNLSMEFCLNIFFFILAPFMILREGLMIILQPLSDEYHEKIDTQRCCQGCSSYIKVKIEKCPKCENDRYLKSKEKEREKAERKKKVEREKIIKMNEKRLKKDVESLEKCKKQAERKMMEKEKLYRRAERQRKKTKLKELTPSKTTMCYSCDSDVEDVKYVRKQMEESRECLAKCRGHSSKLTESKGT